MANDRIRALVALAVDSPDSEESRTAAVRACIEIVKAGMLDRLVVPSHGDPTTWVSMSADPLIQEIMRANEVRVAVERAEYMLRSAEGRTWCKRVCFRRSFCRLCRGFIEEGAVMLSSAVGNRCLTCDERAEAIAKAAEAPMPAAATPKPRAKRSRKRDLDTKEGA